jgi:ABC-type amino acid transport substrate-binding protein
MIDNRRKWITIAVFAGILLVLTMFGAFAVPKQSAFVYEQPEQLAKAGIGGVKTKMPKASAQIFLKSYFGVNFTKYTEFKDFRTALAALRNRRVSAIWVSDVTAEYLCREGGYRALSAPETPGKGENRLEFGFAFRSCDVALKDKTNEMLEKFRNNGITQRLYEYFVNGAKNDSLCGLSGKGRKLRFGITGTVEPLEIIDEKGNFSGMAVELAKYLAAYVDMKVEFVRVDNDTAFSMLMAGKIDVLACYGTSENHSAEVPEYIMSDGYCGMKEYRLLVNK